ncbi:MAG: ribonuclease D [Thermodesulfobacteriota bacterium]
MTDSKSPSAACKAGTDIIWIDNSEALASFCGEARREPFIAVDTEFHRERTYFAKLALVQVALPGKIACIDPLAIRDLQPLDDLLLDSKVLKLMHSGRQDLEIFFDRTGTVPAPLFDTQVAAALLGMGEQTGYASLVEKVCGVSLSKNHARTDWMRRPLNSDVIAYAADDVRYLGQIYRTLDNSLTDRGRSKWLEEEQAMLLAPATYEPDIDNAWQRVKGSNKLDGRSLPVLQILAGWRECEARETDRPKRWILSDEIIINIARQRPKNMDALERMRGLEERVRRKHGPKLLTLVADGAKAPMLNRKRGERKAVSDDTIVDALIAVLKMQARQNDISAAMLASRGDLNRAAAGERDLPLFRGWRKALAGDAIVAFLAGDMKLKTESGQLVLR